jgi:O-methyltransferase involved in polyketide biosynthesis
MTAIDGNTLEGVSATTPWTLHNRGSEAKRSDGVIRDPWAALGLIRDCAARFPGGRMMFDSIPHWVSKRTLNAARDVPWPPGRGWYRAAAWPALDRIGALRRIRPSNTVLEFA